MSDTKDFVISVDPTPEHCERCASKDLLVHGRVPIPDTDPRVWKHHVETYAPYNEVTLARYVEVEDLLPTEENALICKHCGNVYLFSRMGDEEVIITLPVKREVCSRCEGHGTHLTPSIGEYAYSAEEFYEAFDDEESREEYFKRGGMYDVTCEHCKGRNVEEVVDREACARDPKLAEDLARCDAFWEEQADMRREDRAESGWGYDRGYSY